MFDKKNIKNHCTMFDLLNSHVFFPVINLPEIYRIKRYGGP